MPQHAGCRLNSLVAAIGNGIAHHRRASVLRPDFGLRRLQVLWSFGVNRTLQQRATPLLDSVLAAIGDAAAANSVAPDAVTMMMRDAASLELQKSHPE